MVKQPVKRNEPPHNKRADIYRTRENRRFKENSKEKLVEAIRSSDALARANWERDYNGAIEAAFEGDGSRLTDLLRARRTLTNQDYERLADYIELTTRRRGHLPNEAARSAARLARTLLDRTSSLFDEKGQPLTRDEIVKRACESAKKWTGMHVSPSEVEDILRRPKSRRQ